MVHHDASGSTHLLDELSGAALRHIEAGAADADALTRALADTLEISGDEALADRGALVLDAFERLGLVERTP